MSLLKSLSSKKRKRFRKFLVSPFFNENKEVIALFSWIEEGLDAVNGEKRLTKEKTWQYLFGQKPYNDERMRRLCSELTKLTMQFLAVREYNSDHSSEVLYLLPAINEEQLNKHFIGVVRQTKKQLRKDSYQNANFHYLAYQIEKQCHFHLERRVVNSKEPDHLIKADHHMDCYYIINKLWHYVGLLTWKNARSIDSELHFFPGFLDYIAGSKFMEVPAVAVYYNIVLVFLYPLEEKHFYNFRQLLDRNSKYFTKTELQSIYLTAQNYCAYQINLGNLKYYRELFNIYKTLIDKFLLLSKNIIEPGNYKNIITVGLMVDEPEWVEKFIQEFTDYLPKANQDNDRNYNLAKVYFHQKEYEKVISQLREVEYKNKVYALGGKLMLLKTYYELKELNALDSLIDSFRIYLHRNQLISRDVRQQYLNVLRFVRKLPINITYDKKEIEKLREQIKACKALAAKQWLLEKVKEL